jgi:DNA-binding response OmpR family regulator
MMPLYGRSTKRRVMSVEDSDADFLVIRLALEECLPGLEVSRAADGEQAISMLREMMGSTLPDLIFLDRNLPRCSGFDVLRYLNSEGVTEQTPVVMFTSASTAGDRQQALDLGAREVIIKALDLDSLINSIKDVCRRELRVGEA